MYGDNIRTRLDKVVEILVRVGDHQMDIEHLIRCLTQRLDHRRTDRDIGDKMTVHNIHMHIFCTCIGCNFNVAFQIGKIRRKDRRREFDFHRSSSCDHMLPHSII